MTLSSIILLAAVVAPGPDFSLQEVRRFKCAEAHQGVAVDSKAIYAITNRSIGKYDKSTGKLLQRYTAPTDSPIRHMNSGVVVGDRLYCANSNWPNSPLKNSVEIFDSTTLKHQRRQTFPKTTGAINWVERRDDAWWIVFAFYGDQVRRTRLVRYDDKWRATREWRFPESVVKRFLPNSNSGGAFGPNGRLYVTGHDHAELYVLEFASEERELRHISTVAAPIAGQGIAWDRNETNVLYGIVRKRHEVIKLRMHPSKPNER